MIWAKDNLNTRIEAVPNMGGTCPSCNMPVISKCGSIKVWHWAHKNLQDCDAWGEPETQWHIDWKRNFPMAWQEVALENKHRADIKTDKGLVIEFQNSPISPEDIQEREKFYKEMIWVINGESLCKGFDFRLKKTCKECGIRIKGNPSAQKYEKERVISFYNCSECKKNVEVILDRKEGTFRWKNPPKSWWVAKKPIYLDNIIGLHLLKIDKLYSKIPCGGVVTIVKKEEFLKEMKDDS